MTKNYWKPLSLCLLLAGACSEDDVPSTPTDNTTNDSSLVASPDPTVDTPTTQSETLLLNFYAERWHDPDDSELDEHYILISDAEGKALALEACALNKQQAITISNEFTGDKVQVTLLHRGIYTDNEGKEHKFTSVVSFQDVKRGSDWRMNDYYYDYNPKPTPIGYASVVLKSSTDLSNFWLTISGQNDQGNRTEKGSPQANDTIQVAVYKNSTSLLAILSSGDSDYARRIDNVEAGEVYMLDVDKMPLLARKTFSPPSVAYDRVQAGIGDAYVHSSNFSEENALWFGYGYAPDSEGRAYLDYPVDFPAYRTNYRLEKGNTFYEVNLKGALPEQFPLTSFSADIESTSSNSLQMTLEGTCDVFFATWLKDGLEGRVVWLSVGPGKSQLASLPGLPDSLSIDVDAMNLSEVILEEYDYVSSYDQFIEKLHEKYGRMYTECTRYEWSLHDFEDDENSRQGAHARRHPFEQH